MPHFPACFVELPPQCEGRRAAFYLAAEEYIAMHLPEDSYFFTWQIGPTVVMGRNQVAQQEVNIDFCRREGIDICRRRSGGGAIFADDRNIMTSLITEACPVESLFSEYAEAVAAALRQLGAPAMVSGRNDIVLCGEWRVESGEKEPTSARHPEGLPSTIYSRKVCGNAFYHRHDRCIAHGTMLYDTNPELMEGALHPDVSKLEQRGVKSVRSRVGLLKDYLSAIGVGVLRQRLRTLLTDRSICLTNEDIRQIEILEQRYYEEDFRGEKREKREERRERNDNNGGEWREESGERNVLEAKETKLSSLHYSPSTIHQEKILRQRIEGCGMVEVHFQLEDNLIRDIELQGDFFELGDAAMAFRSSFIGIPFTPESLRQAINTHHPECSIRGLSEANLITLLIQQPVLSEEA